jgi:hypothetical protein
MPQQIEVRDSSGKLLGYFIPADPEAALEYEEVRKLFDPEEIKRRKERSRDDPGRSLDQIMDKLRSQEAGK